MGLHLEHLLQLNFVLVDEVARLDGVEGLVRARARTIHGVRPSRRLSQPLPLDSLLVQAELDFGSSDAVHEGVARYCGHLLALAERITRELKRVLTVRHERHRVARSY